MGDPGGSRFRGPRPLDHLLRPRQVREEGDFKNKTDKKLTSCCYTRSTSAASLGMKDMLYLFQLKTQTKLIKSLALQCMTYFGHNIFTLIQLNHDYKLH